MKWQFWLDVGGTFTDCIAIDPQGNLLQHKTLSSGVVTGRANEESTTLCIIDPARTNDPENFWVGSLITVLNDGGQPVCSARVHQFDCRTGCLTLTHKTITSPEGKQFTGSVEFAGRRYQLDCGIPAPVLAIRWLMRLEPNMPCPSVRLRFGTTRGTNALLTRTGARTVLITTRGFADVPLIGNQSRPELFALNIVKPVPLFEQVIEVTERIDASGLVLKPLDTESCYDSVMDQLNSHEAASEVTQTASKTLHDRLVSLRRDGFASVAICLMNAFRNDCHERLIEAITLSAGFDEISRSSEVSPLIRFVPRCDTTLLDAYLNPVLRDYLNALRQHLPDSVIQVMTSSGGLIDSHQFRGRDCVLSGPAGGIVGFSAAAEQEGFQRAIGFDMGGTSTDVARFDGRFEYEQETTKAGVRIMTPVLAIETVAAGGGSICGFDGTRLFVGPQSAGADPGPACYGRGGPLTISDLNLFLGRILPDHFPFALDVKAVDERLAELRQTMLEHGACEETMTLHQLAAGLIRIADDNMVHAIRRVSIAKGYDPLDYVLVSFGGAGGQHACSVAGSLGIRSVLIHPFAGILSAWGMGQADIRAIRQISVLQTLTEETLAALQPDLNRMASETRNELSQQGLFPEAILPVRFTFELRYAGTESGLSVTGSSVKSLRDAFEERHRQQFGYLRPKRSVEIASVTAEAIGRNLPTDSQAMPVGPSWPADRPAVFSESPNQRELNPQRSNHDDQPETTTPVERIAVTWFHDGHHQTPVYSWQNLKAGLPVTGPAIVCEPASTICVEPGWSAQLTDNGSLLLQTIWSETDIRNPDGLTSPVDNTPDPVLLEVFGNQFTSIAEQMGEMLRRTAISTNVRERLDFSCAVFDSDGQLVVNAPHVPVHLGAMSETVRSIMHDHRDMRSGDVYVTNDPFRGGSHLPDVTVVTPVFVAESSHERPEFYVASRAHHAEIGGIVPGSMPPFSRCLAEEGVLIRSQKLVAAGESREDEITRLLLSGPFPSRSVADNMADLAAQVAANACGVRLLQEQVQRHSASTVLHYMKQILLASSQRMKTVLERLPDTQWSFEDALDDGTPVVVKITRSGSEATIDFTGTGGTHPGNLNANRAITTAAVLYTLRCFLKQNVPLNAGVLAPIRLIIPSGLLNPPEGDSPESTPAIVGGNVETSQRIVDVLFGALGMAAASQGTMNNLTFGNETFGYYETIGGGAGATSSAQGADAVHTHMTNTRLTDPEILEQRYPVRLHRFGIRPDSGGAGRHRGGHGIIREIEFLQDVKLSILSQRRTLRPWGIEGGECGQPGLNLLQRPTDTEFTDIGGAFSEIVTAGTRLRIETPGGGGYGTPSDPNTRTNV